MIKAVPSGETEIGFTIGYGNNLAIWKEPLLESGKAGSCYRKAKNTSTPDSLRLPELVFIVAVFVGLRVSGNVGGRLQVGRCAVCVPVALSVRNCHCMEWLSSLPFCLSSASASPNSDTPVRK